MKKAPPGANFYIIPLCDYAYTIGISSPKNQSSTGVGSGIYSLYEGGP